MRMRCMLSLVVLTLAWPALAQQGPGGRGSGGQGRGQGAQPGQPGRPGAAMFERIARQLTEELGLSAEQQAQLDKIVASFRNRGPQGTVTEMQEVEEQLRAAREANDEQKVKELQGRLNDLRAKLRDSFLNEVEKILEPSQREKFAELRPRLAQLGAGVGGGMGQAELLRAVGELPQKLNLDDKQRGKFDELLAKLRGDIQARQDQAKETQSLTEELRRARQAGDEKRVAEIREKLEKARGEAGRPFQDFYASLEKILNDEQKTKLTQIRAELERAGGQQRQSGDIRSILQAVRKLDLSAEQQKQVQDLGDKALKQERDLARGDREAHLTLARDFKKQISDLLTPEQKAQFEKNLEQERPQGRTERQDRPAQPEQPDKEGKGPGHGPRGPRP